MGQTPIQSGVVHRGAALRQKAASWGERFVVFATSTVFTVILISGPAAAQPVFPGSSACDTSAVPAPFDRVVRLLCEVHDIIVALTVIFGAVSLAWASYRFIRGDIEHAKQLIIYTATGVILAVLSKELVMWAVRLLADTGGS